MASENIQTDENSSEESEYYLFNPTTNDILIDVYLYRSNLGGFRSIGREVRVRNFDSEGNETDCSDIVNINDALLIAKNGCTDDELFEKALKIAKDDMPHVLNDIIYEIHAETGELDLPEKEVRQYHPIITYHEDRD